MTIKVLTSNNDQVTWLPLNNGSNINIDLTGNQVALQIKNDVVTAAMIDNEELITGPTGPAGNNGAAGDTGPTGPAGPTGTGGDNNVINVVVQSSYPGQPYYFNPTYDASASENNNLFQLISSAELGYGVTGGMNLTSNLTYVNIKYFFDGNQYDNSGTRNVNRQIVNVILPSATLHSGKLMYITMTSYGAGWLYGDSNYMIFMKVKDGSEYIIKTDGGSLSSAPPVYGGSNGGALQVNNFGTIMLISNGVNWHQISPFYIY